MSETDTKELESNSQLKVIKKIATGGMGNVYLAEQHGFGGFKKIVALKTIRKDMLGDAKIKMFTSEAKLVADLIHENIMQVYNLCSVKNDFFIVMEYIKGITFSKFLKRHKDLGVLPDTEMIAFICSRVARALSYAHTKRDHNDQPLQVVHRDVTPANIMIDALGVVKLTDFGIAKGVTMGTPDEKKVLMGKYPYMSPEQVRLEGTDARSDIFSLGLVMHEALTHKRVFPVKSRDDLLRMLETKTIKPLCDINKSVKPELSSITMEMLNLDKEKRTPNARHTVLALEKYMYGAGYGPTNEKLALYMKQLFKKKKQPQT